MPQPELPRYRWVIVSAFALILALALGSIINGISAYGVPLDELRGWGRAEMSLINVSGIMGFAPGAMAGESSLQPFLGTAIGITVLAALLWFGLEAAGRRLTPLVPKVAGSWVAAIGVLIVEFST